MNIIFRVDSSVEIGTGHVMRCLTLAKQLNTTNSNIIFISRKLKGDIIKIIEDNGFPVYVLAPLYDYASDLEWYEKCWETDALDTIDIIKENNLEPDILIVDHYGLEERWETSLKKFVQKVLIIDDLANRKHNCEFLVDQNYYLNLSTRYEGLVPENCREMLGPKFVLLREEFFKIFSEIKKHDGHVRNILVFFGGTDPTNETLKTLRALSSLKQYNFDVNVIVGASNPLKEDIKRYCEKQKKFHFYCQVSNISTYMNMADLAIGAGGTTTWERCYLGLPSITITVADNQVEATKAVEHTKSTIYLGHYNSVTEEQIKQKVEQLLHDKEALITLSTSASLLVNAEIVNTKPLSRVILEEIDIEHSR
ncbi:UDP-2,4-diacetamido-2,4,6-trideoxy-beta-L-altropyranose hydrolase [Priestia megaterium]|uniref:UDP-2,4-diacetamido-2,4, 6-trideoxy-beta-L-altropyranose hydrolase n=1 Tax=Priestia megaterium TaxID=1404 RepID=UPI00300ADA8F